MAVTPHTTTNQATISRRGWFCRNGVVISSIFYSQ